MNEIWKNINEGYQVSDLGRVRSIGEFGRVLKPTIDKDGYCIVWVGRDNGKRLRGKVHRFVCLAFLPNMFNLKQVNHKNGIRADNRLINLEWCSNSYNALHAFRVLGRIHARGASKPLVNSKGDIFYCMSEASKVYGIKLTTLSAMLNGVSRNRTDLSFKQK